LVVHHQFLKLLNLRFARQFSFNLRDVVSGVRQGASRVDQQVLELEQLVIDLSRIYLILLQ
jgi:hypothetical protein